MTTENCTKCGTLMFLERDLDNSERMSLLCWDCTHDRMMAESDADAFRRFELPKFKMLIQDFEHGIYTVEDFYSRMAELVEPF